MGEEVWRPAFDGGDMYDVSDHGRVRSRVTGKLMKLTVNSVGYVVVGIHKGKQWKVHRLVAFTFLPETGPLVRHLDGNKLNNHLDNLAFGDSRDNNRDTVRHGHHVNAAKTQCKRGHPYDDSNTYWTRNGRDCRACKAWRQREAARAA